MVAYVTDTTACSILVLSAVVGSFSVALPDGDVDSRIPPEKSTSEGEQDERKDLGGAWRGDRGRDRRPFRRDHPMERDSRWRQRRTYDEPGYAGNDRYRYGNGYERDFRSWKYPGYDRRDDPWATTSRPFADREPRPEPEARPVNKDDNRAFFESLLPAVKKFSLDQRLHFRSEVLDLLKRFRTPQDSES